MEKDLTWIDALKMGLIIGGVGSIIFLITEVFWAQQIKDFLIDLYEEGDDGLLTLIILIGFLIGIIISLIVSEVTAKNFVDERYILYASLFAFLTNFIFWIIISYVFITIRYPFVLEQLNAWGKIIVFPRVMSYFAIYVIQDIPLFWILNIVSYTLFFIIFLKSSGAQIQSGYNYDFMV